MEIAILTSLDFKIPGGAERFFIDLAAALDATIVCLSLDTELFTRYPDAEKVRFHPLNVNLPGEPLKQIAGMVLFKRLNLKYDFYIVTDDMALRFLKKDTPHIYMVLTPRRALYDMYYPTLSTLHHGRRELYIIFLSLFRFMDRRFVRKYVKSITCISHNVRNRIWKAYQSPSTVIYPPIHTERYRNYGYHDFWLSVSRVDKWKRIELQLETFRLLPDMRLIIAGTVYPEYKELVDNAPPNVSFYGTVGDAELITLYGTCRGFLTTAIDEDYGLTPLEAMASGKPVVAVREGGYLETVVEGQTGFLVGPEPSEIAAAIRQIDPNPEYYEEEGRRRAELFDYKVFKEQIVTYVHNCVHNM